MMDKETACIVSYNWGETDNISHACIHWVIVLRRTLDFEHIATLMFHNIGFFLIIVTQKWLQGLIEFTQNHLKIMIDDLVLLIPKKQSAAWIYINDGTIVIFLDTYNHNSLTCIRPILKNYLRFEIKWFLYTLQNSIEHGFIILYRLQILHIQTSHLLTVGDLTYFVISLPYFLSDSDSSCPDFIQFLEIRMVLVEYTPKL